ncbi:Metallo-dependent hydrolase [Phlegmacium glaucopus]|nr:Metallo-dependent hydrolase [Phlegmacium glaucopus]
MLIRGSLVHTPRLGELEILDNHLIAVNNEGIITHLESIRSPKSIEILQRYREDQDLAVAAQPLLDIPSGSFLLPSFCDLHLHAPQFLYQGTGLDLPLMEWLDKYALKAESRLDANPNLAHRLYTRLANRLKENGTGAVLLFGTIKEETNLILAECMQSAGLRAYVGKLSMDIDISSPQTHSTEAATATDTYIEHSARESLESAKSFIKRCQQLTSTLSPSHRLVEPVLTPRFTPTCSDELLKGLGEISAEQGVKIQSHLAEAKDQVEWVRAERGMEDIDVFHSNNLLTSQTIQAHCTFLSISQLSLLSSKGTSIAHCPLSNAYFSATPFPLREALIEKVKVGLGTDVAGGYSLDIMNAMRQAVVVSRMREGSRVMGMDAEISMDSKLSIDWKEALFLATRGGAMALGLHGIFGVGLPFDAQEIKIYDPTSGVGIGALDYFDLETSKYESQTKSYTCTPPSSEEIEKWWCIGDVRNRVGMWIQGRRVFGS